MDDKGERGRELDDGNRNAVNDRNESAWVVLEHTSERFTPTQQLAFPYLDSSSGSSISVAQQHYSAQRSMTPAFSIFPPNSSTTLTPGTGMTSLHLQRYNSMPFVSRSNNSSPEDSVGERMLEAEHGFDLRSPFHQLRGSSHDSLSLTSDDRDLEISNIFGTDQFNTERPELYENDGSYFFRAKSAAEEIEELIQKIKNRSKGEENEKSDVIDHVKTKQIERLEQVKRDNLKDDDIDSEPSEEEEGDGFFNLWIFDQWRKYFILIGQCLYPITTTHLAALLVGIYIGKSAFRK